MLLYLQSKAFSGMPKSAHSVDRKPWGEGLPWDKEASSVSQDIQRSDLARAQLLSTGGKYTPEAQEPAEIRRDKARHQEALEPQKPTNAPTTEAASAATETPKLRKSADGNGAVIPAETAPSLEHRQNNAALGGPGSQSEAAAETPPVSKAVFARQLGEGGGNFPTPEVPSSVKNPLFEASSSASVGSSSTGAASVRQLGFQASGINPTFEHQEAHSPAAGTKSSASFRSAVRRAAHRSRQEKQDGPEDRTSPHHAPATKKAVSKDKEAVLPQWKAPAKKELSGLPSRDQPALQGVSREEQKLLLGREGNDLGGKPVTSSEQRQNAPELETHLPDRSISSLSSPGALEEPAGRRNESKAKEATMPRLRNQSQVEAANEASTPQESQAGMSSIWKLWNSGEAATESLQHENRASRASNKSVRCSLLDSMNSVSDELRQVTTNRVLDLLAYALFLRAMACT